MNTRSRSTADGPARGTRNSRRTSGGDGRGPLAPLELLCSMVGGEERAKSFAARNLRAAFRQPMPSEIAAYTIPLLAMVQTTPSPEVDLAGAELGARNKFGVTLLHKTLRYPNWASSKYLMTRCPDLCASRDDLGRVPLHDACWNEALDFETIDLLLRADPCQLACADNRGHTPLCYAPRSSWAQWAKFLEARREFFQAAFDGAVPDPDALPTPASALVGLAPALPPPVVSSEDLPVVERLAKRPKPSPESSPTSPTARWTEVTRSVLEAHCPQFAAAGPDVLPLPPPGFASKSPPGSLASLASSPPSLSATPAEEPRLLDL